MTPFGAVFFGTKTGITKTSMMSLQQNRHKSEETGGNLHCRVLHLRIQTFLRSKGRFSIVFAFFRIK